MKKILLGLLAVTIITGCRVMFIGPYDQVTDQGIQRIENDVSVLFVKMEKRIQEGTYTAATFDTLKNDFYAIEGEIRSLQIRCSTLPKYEKVQGELNSLRSTVDDLELLARTQLRSVKILEPAESAFEIEFKAITTLQNGLKNQK